MWTTVKFTKNESIDLPPNYNKSKILLFVVSIKKHNVLSNIALKSKSIAF